MRKFKVILKEIFELIIRKFGSVYRQISFDKKAYKQFKNDGYLVLDKKLDKLLCDKIIKSFEDLISSNKINSKLWEDQTGSDTRLFFAQDYIDEINEILNDKLFNSFSTKFYGRTITNKFSLMNRVIAVNGNLGSGGGWHRDSPITHQLKVLIYLNDVNIGNGQFQYIENSAHKVNILKALYKYNWVNKYRFTHDEILKYNEDFNSKIINFIGNKGTIIVVDTKGIHRGSPILEGKRYAIFNYYYKGIIPFHFSRYKTA